MQNQSRRQIRPRKGWGCTDHVEGASVPRSTRQVPRYLALLDPGPAAHPWEAPTLPHQCWMDPGPCSMRLSTWNFSQSHNSQAETYVVN